MPHILTCFLILAVSLPVFALDDVEKAAGMFNDSEYAAAKKLLQSVRVNDRAAFDSADLGYLLARTAEKEGDYATAVREYQAVASSDSVLREYGLKHLSRLARESGNLFLERLFLTELIYTSESKTLNGPARLRLARTLHESSEFEALIELIERGDIGSTASGQVNDRELGLLHAKALSSIGRNNKAKSVFEQLIEELPNSRQPDDIALEAAKGLDRIDVSSNQNGGDVGNLTALEHKMRGDIYQFNRAFGRARIHFQAIIERHPGNEEIPSATYKIARGFVQERDDQNAAIRFAEMNSVATDPKLAAAALYGLAGALANSGETEKSVEAYTKYIDENPEATNTERAYMNIIDAYRDSGEQAKALEWTAKARSDLKGEVGESVALFAEARIFTAAEDWDRALSVLNRLRMKEKLGGIRIAGGTNKPEVEFLRGYALEMLGRKAEAIDAYREIKDGRREYYGWLASQRGVALDPTIESPDKASSGQPQQSKSEDRIVPYKLLRIPNLDKTSASLLRLGLFDEAAPSIEISLRTALEKEGDQLSDFDGDTAFTLATYYARGGYADRAVRFIEPKWKKIPRDFPIAQIPAAEAQLLYPVPFRDSLINYGKEKKIDPRFILSIMRQESRFQADIKSVAAARGLMQFVSGTSKKMAEEMKVTGFTQNDLYSPQTAIRFGSHYVSNLFGDFPDQPQAVAASYNGGEDRMARWLKRANTNAPERYVPEIIFSQTKDYVYKVMSNYRMYKLLYDENLMPVNNKNVKAETN
jgi:soluble lytic murein transglycosylase